MKKVKFIYNPYSGNKAILDKIDTIIDIYQIKGYTIIPYRIEKQKDVIFAFEDDDFSEYSHILIAGGDGTVDSVVNAMYKKNVNLPIGILPVGTANDFAKFLKIPSSIEGACQLILNTAPKDIDLAKINDKYFVNVASTGLFADVSQKTDINLKNTIGKLAYCIKGLEELPNFRKIKMSLKSNEATFEGDVYLLLIFNGKTAGNFTLAVDSDAQDGLLDVVVFKAIPVREMIPLFISVLKGEHLESDKVLYFKTNKIHIECDENIETDIDGETGPAFPLDIECIKSGLKILGIK